MLEKANITVELYTTTHFTNYPNNMSGTNHANNEATRFPYDVYEEIRKLPGNEKCCDCSSLDTDWGSVNHGTLICLECAGKHRSLGVYVSFVRSIHMDTWTKRQVKESPHLTL